MNTKAQGRTLSDHDAKMAKSAHTFTPTCGILSSTIIKGIE